MDDLDQQLIARLRANARAPVAELATALKVSRGTVTNRMARLEREGVISGYTLRLRPDAAREEVLDLDRGGRQPAQGGARPAR
jgi:DNA-binding Lrp family transcriptional regulator